MGFTTFGLHDHVMQGIAATGYTGPTPIQTLAIPPALEGKDVIGCAQTGTGKTAAFVLPILHRLAKSGPSGDSKRGARALILAPTRELAQQVQDAANGYGKALSIRTVAIVGGADMSKQVALLRRGADIVVATPGRLLDHLQRGTIDLSLVQVLVLDEADRMLDMGFIHDVRKIIGAVPKDRQTMFFSATVSPDVNDLARGILKDPVSVDAGGRTNPAETIVQHFYEAPQGGKFDLLIHSLESEKMESVLVFSRTKHGADKICRRLERQGIAAAALHSNRSQPQRERALEGFKQGKFRVLVATDIAARGIDVSGISHVINFDIPQFPEDYIHRIGRTGRAGASGDAVTFVGSDDQQYLRRIEKYTGKRFTVKKYPGGVPALPGPASVSQSAPRRTPHAKVALSPQRAKPVQGGSPMGVPFRQRPARVKKQTILATRKRKGSVGKLDSFSSDRDGGAWSNY